MKFWLVFFEIRNIINHHFHIHINKNFELYNIMDKLEHLRESIIVHNCKSISNDLYNQKMNESINYSPNDVIKLAESLCDKSDRSLLEGIIKTLKEKGSTSERKTWKLPIARYDNLNGNKRIYPKKLYENVRDKQRDAWYGIAGLADHPVDDGDAGSFRNSAIVWLDIIVGDDGIVYGIGRFVGPYGELAEEIIEAGGKVGFSMSGWGNVGPNNTVDPDSYIIERLSDCVIAPSQSVYGTIDCAHTPADFMKDVHKGATLEYDSNVIRESKSQIISKRMKEMADQNNLKVNAAQGGQPSPAAGETLNQQKPAAQNQAVPNQQGQPAAQQQAGVPPQKPQQESVKMSQNKGLSKIEEKAFRKYAEAFVADMGKLDNPIRKLEECQDILDCFDEGNCPDLKAKLEESLIQEKARLEKLVETTVKMEQDFKMDVPTIREKLEARIGEGLLLRDQVADQDTLIEGLTIRNQKLIQENKDLKKLVFIRTKLSEKLIGSKNKYIVDTDTEIDRLRTAVDKLQEDKRSIYEKIKSFNKANSEFEKENGKLQTKLKEAVRILERAKADLNSKDNEVKKLTENISQLKNVITRKDEKITKLTEKYEANQQRFDKLKESFDNYKQEVKDTYDPTAHLIPNSTERVGKYLNLRENKGTEVEEYWTRLVEQYGEDVAPFEDKIRNAKTLQESTNYFLKFRDQIDKDFKVGGESPMDYAVRNKAELKQLTEQLGQVVPNKEDWDIEQINANFLESQKKQGLL